MHLGPDLLREMWALGLLREAVALLFGRKGGRRHGTDQ
jgi:hypothetical protein